MRLPDVGAMYRDMAAKMPDTVKCGTCGRVETVDAAACLRSGWPKCHGYTMGLVSPVPPAGASDGK